MSSDETRPENPEDLEHVRVALHDALERARAQLEWTEILLLLYASRAHEREARQHAEHTQESGAESREGGPPARPPP